MLACLFSAAHAAQVSRGVPASILASEKFRVTFFNDSAESVLVSLDTEKFSPQKKNSIDKYAAKYFFLPMITPMQPYYLLVEGSGGGGLKEFVLRVEGTRLGNQTLILYRGRQQIASVPLIDPTKGMKIFFHGSFKPAFPEVEIKRGE